MKMNKSALLQFPVSVYFMYFEAIIAYRGSRRAG